MAKITEEQLEQLQKTVGDRNKLQSDLGAIEIEKHEILNNVVRIQESMKELQLALENEYGTVSINLQDGEITETPNVIEE